MFGSLGVPELLLIFVVILLVFGPRRIPEIGKTLGKALGEFRKATDDLKNTIEREVRIEELKSIKTPSLESFVTPVEAVSRVTPVDESSSRQVDGQVVETDGVDEADQVVESSSRQAVDEPDSPETARPLTAAHSTTRRPEDSTT